MSKLIGRGGDILSKLGLSPAGIPVITSTANYPANPFDGQVVRLRLPGFLAFNMVYDAVLAAWVPMQGLSKIWNSTLAGVVLPTASIGPITVPSGFRNIVITGIARDSAPGTLANTNIRLNGDSSAIYDVQFGRNEGAVADSSQIANSNAGILGQASAAGAAADDFSSFRVTIENYSGTAHRKIINGDGTTVFVDGAGARVNKFATVWRNKAAVASLTFVAGATFIAGTDISIFLEA